MMFSSSFPPMPRLLLAASLLIPTLLAADLAHEGQQWWQHVRVLADDNMEGRLAGSPGHLRAARYIAEQFERAGLQPGAGKDYLQPVALESRVVVEPQTKLDLVRDGKATPVILGEDAMVSARHMGETKTEAPLVFVGYGLTVPELKYDDLAGLDLKGKVIVTLAGAPNNIPGPLRAHYNSLHERWPFLEKAGVVGVISIPNPKNMDIPWERMTLARLQPSMVYRDATLNDAEGLRFTATMNPARADKLLAGSGHTIAELTGLANADKPLPKFSIPGSVRASVMVKTAPVESQNVVGIVKGTDPKLQNEYVVLSAHLDHLGVGEPINGDRIYNGAMDDASGVATLIEIARSLHDQHKQLKRSVAFIAVTGEEKGLLGSHFFAKRPTIKRENIVADMNFDMFLPLYPLKSMLILGLDESTLGDDIRAVAQAHGLKVQADPEPARNRFVRSDQYSFIREGIPALAFKFGYEKGSPEEQKQKTWTHDRYHAPSDDLAQPVDKEAAAQFNQVLVEMATRLANEPQRPAWKPDSFFKRFAK